MGKYEPLSRYLASRSDGSWDARFTEIERILGFELPDSAHRYPAWWANQDGHHSQTKGWRDAGWETSNIDLAAKCVRFQRAKRRGSVLAEQGKGGLPSRLDELWKQAETISGISDRNELVEAALKAFIQRETAAYVASLGGSMPDAEAAPRRRFSW